MVSTDSRSRRVGLRIVAIEGRVLVERLEALSRESAGISPPSVRTREKRSSFWGRLLADFAYACELYFPYQLHHEMAERHCEPRQLRDSPDIAECEIEHLDFPPMS